MPEKKFNVGDTVLVTSVNSRGKGPVERTVVKVGRLNVTIDGGYHGARPKTYTIAEGWETGQYSHEHLYTVQEWANKQERQELRVRFMATDLHDIHSTRFEKIPVAKLRAILAILEADEYHEDTPTQKEDS
jgi:hypothetical protein